MWSRVTLGFQGFNIWQRSDLSLTHIYSNLGRVALPSLTGSAFLFGADLGVEKDDADLGENSDDLLGVDECIGALPVEITLEWR